VTRSGTYNITATCMDAFEGSPRTDKRIDASIQWAVDYNED